MAKTVGTETSVRPKLPDIPDCGMLKSALSSPAAFRHSLACSHVPALYTGSTAGWGLLRGLDVNASSSR